MIPLLILAVGFGVLWAIKTVKPTHCKWCGRTFPSNGALNHHITTYHVDN